MYICVIVRNISCVIEDTISVSKLSCRRNGIETSDDINEHFCES